MQARHSVRDNGELSRVRSGLSRKNIGVNQDNGDPEYEFSEDDSDQLAPETPGSNNFIKPDIRKAPSTKKFISVADEKRSPRYYENLKNMELRKWRQPLPSEWQNIMLSKPQQDLPPLSDGDI